jgi:type IV secretion system protein TrbL
MGGTGVIDHFLEVFTSYIDSGFGLLGGEVGFIATTLIVIDVTLAALFWSWGADDDIIARLVKKTLFVGVFAYIIGNWNNLARIVFESFAGLGLKASGTGFTAADLLRPGKVAQTGLDAGRPLLDSISDLMGYWSLLRELHPDRLLLFAWALVLLAFFILADPALRHPDRVQADDARRLRADPLRPVRQDRLHGRAGARQRHLLRHQGAGAGRHHRHRLDLFAQFTAGFGGDTPTIDDAMAIVLARASLLGLGIFGPGIANGLVSGGPQLGAAQPSEPALPRRPSIHYGTSPEPVTPYQRAAQVWDDRIGSARVQAKNWRLAFFGCLRFRAGWQAVSSGNRRAARSRPGWCRSTSSARHRPSRLPMSTYRPTDPQIAFHLARFIEQVRAIPADPIVVRQNWLRAYDFTTDRGAQALNDYARANDPFAQVGKVQVAVDVSSVIRASNDSFRVAWTERRYQDGALSRRRAGQRS